MNSNLLFEFIFSINLYLSFWEKYNKIKKNMNMHIPHYDSAIFDGIDKDKLHLISVKVKPETFLDIYLLIFFNDSISIYFYPIF